MLGPMQGLTADHRTVGSHGQLINGTLGMLTVGIIAVAAVYGSGNQLAALCHMDAHCVIRVREPDVQHDIGIQIAAIGTVIPDDGASAVLAQECCHTVHEITLKFTEIGKTFLLHSALAMGTLLPAVLGCFVATDMEPGCGEQFQQFSKQRFNKIKDFVPANTEQFVGNGRLGHHFHLLATAA